MGDNTPSDVHAPSLGGGHSKEYLNAYHEASKEVLPSWMREQIHKIAKPKSGGVARHRKPEHSALESLQLKSMSEDGLTGETNESLLGMIEDLCDHRKLAARNKMPTDLYDRAGGFVAAELQRRGMEFVWSDPTFGEAVVQKSTLLSRVELMPDEIDLGPGFELNRDEDCIVAAVTESDTAATYAAMKSACVGAGVQIGIGGYSKSVGKGDVVYDLLLRRRGSVDAISCADGFSFTTTDSDVVSISKSALAEKRLIWYMVAEPNVPDYPLGEEISATDIEDACHRFALTRNIRIEHGMFVGLNFDGRWPQVINKLAIAVENYIAPQSISTFFGKPLSKPVLEGSWLACIYYPDDALWEFLRDTPHGISLAGLARKEIR